MLAWQAAGDMHSGHMLGIYSVNVVFRQRELLLRGSDLDHHHTFMTTWDQTQIKEIFRLPLHHDKLVQFEPDIVGFNM